MAQLLPTDEQKEDIFLSCRYGDLEEIQQFVKDFGADLLSVLRDENGSSLLHMVCGNGHGDVLDYMLSLVSVSLLSAQNDSQSTPLHWAALNRHLDIVKKLIQYPGGPGIDLIDIKNAAGRSPLGEAEIAGWDEGAQWLVEMMKLDEKSTREEEGPLDTSQDVEIEIQDAEGQIAKMTITKDNSDTASS